MVIAREAASQCKCVRLQLCRGSYVLGTTLPDVHVITASMSRKDTHFFDLNQKSDGGSVEAFLKTHPELNKDKPLTGVIRATVAGYLSHLVVDDLWIAEIYRPFFGPTSSLADDPQANLLDRALQHELEKKERDDLTARDDILSLLHDPLPVDVLGFLDASALERWQGFVYALAKRQFNWENFNNWVQKALMPREKLEAERVKHFLSVLPEKRQMAVQLVTWQRLEAFKQQGVSLSLSLLDEYFS